LFYVFFNQLLAQNFDLSSDLTPKYIIVYIWADVSVTCLSYKLLLSAVLRLFETCMNYSHYCAGEERERNQEIKMDISFIISCEGNQMMMLDDIDITFCYYLK